MRSDRPEPQELEPCLGQDEDGSPSARAGRQGGGPQSLEHCPHGDPCLTVSVTAAGDQRIYQRDPVTARRQARTGVHTVDSGYTFQLR